jgi:hypothetical protein
MVEKDAVSMDFRKHSRPTSVGPANAPIKKRPPNTLGQREALTRVVDWTMTRAVISSTRTKAVACDEITKFIAGYIRF